MAMSGEFPDLPEGASPLLGQKPVSAPPDPPTGSEECQAECKPPSTVAELPPKVQKMLDKYPEKSLAILAMWMKEAAKKGLMEQPAPPSGYQYKTISWQAGQCWDIETPTNPPPSPAQPQAATPQRISRPLDLRRGGEIRLSEEEVQLAKSPPILATSGIRPQKQSAVLTNLGECQKLWIKHSATIKAALLAAHPNWAQEPWMENALSEKKKCGSSKGPSMCYQCYPELKDLSWLKSIIDQEGSDVKPGNDAAAVG